MRLSCLPGSTIPDVCIEKSTLGKAGIFKDFREKNIAAGARHSWKSTIYAVSLDSGKFSIIILSL